MFQAARPDAVIIDYKLPNGTALDLLPRIKGIDSGTPIVILTAHGSIDLAVRAIKEGADQFVTKPIELPALLVMLQRILEEQRGRQRRLARKSRHARESVDPFLGTSAVIRRLVEESEKVISSDSSILIQSETGTGKGVLARWLPGQRSSGGRSLCRSQLRRSLA